MAIPGRRSRVSPRRRRFAGVPAEPYTRPRAQLRAVGGRMPEQPIKEKTAIAGVGWTPRYSRDSGTTVLNLTLEAGLNAINDAGLSPKDIDGVVTYWWERDTIYPREL